MKTKKILLIILSLALIGIYMRLADHPANFSPVMAIALFAGVYLPKKWFLILPLVIMFITDLFIGFYDLRLMAVVYAALVIAGIIGLAIRQKKNLATIITGSLLAAVIFFISTNLAVWGFSSWYPHTLNGLLYNYALAVPFFRNTMLSNVFFTGILFGSYELFSLWLKNSRQIFLKNNKQVSSKS